MEIFERLVTRSTAVESGDARTRKGQFMKSVHGRG